MSGIAENPQKRKPKTRKHPNTGHKTHGRKKALCKKKGPKNGAQKIRKHFLEKKVQDRKVFPQDLVAIFRIYAKFTSQLDGRCLKRAFVDPFL